MKAVLIPSSSGRVFKHVARREGQHWWWVLIPSSSGRVFKRDLTLAQRASVSLNPFFIRASLQAGPPPSGLGRQRRLNPFFIRASLQACRPVSWRESRPVLIPSSSGRVFKRRVGRGDCSGRPVLIPSSSGRVFKPAQDARARAWQGLNPFFIRASLQADRPARAGRRGGVLIPSSSGRVFKRDLNV